MNRRDTTHLARALGAAHELSFHAQTAATTWYFAIEAVADALAEGNAEFDRVAFLRECRAAEPPAKERCHAQLLARRVRAT